LASDIAVFLHGLVLNVYFHLHFIINLVYAGRDYY